jgi:LCP family protein required for cell wall assembly
MSGMGNHHPVRKAIISFLAVLMLSGAVYSGFLFFTTVRALVAQTALPFTESIGSQPERAESDEQPARVRLSPGAQELPDISGKKDRVNILLMGIDQRAGDPGPWRTDTMILVSIDPATNSASMLSIPRDLWVPIPGMGENRINMAHYLGDANDYPGGGPALAQKTVWYALGIPVHYYVRINFDGFERLLDAIGGITVNVEKPIDDDKYPDGNYGTMQVHIPAGVQQMDGRTALQFARSRHGTGDFDRMARQQALIVAARDKVLNLDIPISSLPKMLDLAGDTISTNLSFGEMYALAQMVKQIGRDQIRHGVIDDSMTTTVTTPEQWMVEVPDWDKVQKLVDELFPAPSPSTEPTPDLTQSQLAVEGARIALQNGTLVTGLAEERATALRAAGFNVVRFENADRFDHADSLIITHVDKPFTIKALADRLDIASSQIIYDAEGASGVDIVVVLGRDLAP